MRFCKKDGEDIFKQRLTNTHKPITADICGRTVRICYDDNKGGKNMGYYKNPEDMYTQRAARFKRDADRHYAQAKAGEGGYHYQKAKFAYERSAANAKKAEEARATGAVFRSGRKSGR